MLGIFISWIMFCWKLNMKLIRKRVFTLARAFVLFILIPGLVIVDIIATPFIYMFPKTFLPFGTPEMTLDEMVRFLADYSVLHGEQQTNHWILAMKLFKERPPEFWLTQIPFILLLGFLLVMFYKAGWPYKGKKKDIISDEITHGSSRWRTPREYLKTLHKVKTNEPDKSGIVVGSKGNKAWITNPDVGNPHSIIIGATRSGKTRRVILPSIWTIGNKKESMIISDPKGELYQFTSQWLKDEGYEVILIDLLKPSRGNQWNPLDIIVKSLKGGDEEEAVRQAWELGNMLAWSKGGGNDPIWPQAEESLITALFLATAIEAKKGQKHPASAYATLINLGMNGGDELDKYFSSLPIDHPARMAYGTAALSESRTRSSIYTGTAAKLRLFGEIGISWLCSKSDHNPKSAGEKPTAIFLLLPDEAGSRRDIASMYVNQAYSSLVSLAREKGGKLRIPVWFLLDEFGNIGKIPNLPEKLTVSAGRNIRFVMAVQSLAQIEHVYGKKAAEIIEGNCDSWIYLRTTDLGTAQTLSRMTGQFTVKTKSVQKRKIDVSESEGATSRFLLTPDEILRWKIGESLLIQAGQYPAKIPLQDLSKWEEANKVFRSIEMLKPIHIERSDVWIPGRESKIKVKLKENISRTEEGKKKASF